MIKTLYKIEVGDDLGELWLGDNLQPIGFVMSRDTNFAESEYNFIFTELGARLVLVWFDFGLDEELWDAVCDQGRSANGVWNLIKHLVIPILIEKDPTLLQRLPELLRNHN